jgi:hypothetical protein
MYSLNIDGRHRGRRGWPSGRLFCAKREIQETGSGFFYAIMVISAALFAAGIAALVSGQPYVVLYGLGFPGLLCLIIFGVLIGVVSRR